MATGKDEQIFKFLSDQNKTYNFNNFQLYLFIYLFLTQLRSRISFLTVTYIFLYNFPQDMIYENLVQIILSYVVNSKNNVPDVLQTMVEYKQSARPSSTLKNRKATKRLIKPMFCCFGELRTKSIQQYNEKRYLAFPAMAPPQFLKEGQSVAIEWKKQNENEIKKIVVSFCDLVAI